MPSIIEGEAMDNRQLPKHFQWGHVGPHTINLLWDVQALGERYATHIQLFAKPPKHKFSAFRMVPFSFGRANVSKLKPATRYEVTVRKLAKLKLEVIFLDYIYTRRKKPPLPFNSPEY